MTVAAELASRGGNNAKNLIFKNCAPLTECISKINNKPVDNAKDIDIVIPMYNLIEYSDNYLSTSGLLWQNYRDEPCLNNACPIFDFTGANKLLKYKQK